MHEQPYLPLEVKPTPIEERYRGYAFFHDQIMEIYDIVCKLDKTFTATIHAGHYCTDIVVHYFNFKVIYVRLLYMGNLTIHVRSNRSALFSGYFEETKEFLTCKLPDILKEEKTK